MTSLKLSNRLINGKFENLCYVNSILNLLYSNKDFASYFKDKKYLELGQDPGCDQYVPIQDRPLLVGSDIGNLDRDQLLKSPINLNIIFTERDCINNLGDVFVFLII